MSLCNPNVATLGSIVGRGMAGAVLIFTSAATLAHPNHLHAPLAGFWVNVAHLLSQPDHVALLVAAVVAAVLGLKRLHSLRRADRHRLTRRQLNPTPPQQR